MSNEVDEFGILEQLRSTDPDKCIEDLEPFNVKYADGTDRDVSAQYQAKTAIDAWRADGNAAKGLNALWTLTVARIDLPKDLRNWFADCLLLTLSGEGDVSMDRAFGLTDSSGAHSAFTKHNKKLARSNNNHRIHRLVTLHGFSDSLASRLEHEKQRHEGEHEVLAATTMRSEYSKVKGSLDAPLVLFLDKSAEADFRVRALKTYDVPGLSPDDRRKLHSAIAAV